MLRLHELLSRSGVTFGMYVGKTPAEEADITGPLKAAAGEFSESQEAEAEAWVMPENRGKESYREGVIYLRPLNPDFNPIEIGDAEEVKVIAELVEVLT